MFAYEHHYLTFSRLEATSDELFNSASMRFVAVPDKSQGAKMDQSINQFTQGPPTLYPFTLFLSLLWPSAASWEISG